MNHLERIRRLLNALLLLESIPLTSQPRTAGRIAKQAGLGRGVAYRFLPVCVRAGLAMEVIEPRYFLGRMGKTKIYFLTSKGKEWLQSQKELF